MNILNLLVMIASAVYVLVLPGLALSFVFFRRRSIDVLERLALSFALSIAVVPLVAFYLNLLGLKLSRLSVLAEVAAVIALAVAGAWWRARRAHPAEPPLAPAAASPAPPAPVPPVPSRPAPAKRPPSRRRMGL